MNNIQNISTLVRIIYFFYILFKVSEKYELNRNNLKCDYIRYSPFEISTISTLNSQVYIKIPREGSVFSLLNSYLDLNFDVLHAATNNRYADGNDIRLVNLGPVALFSKYKLTTSSGKHLENIDHAHIVSVMYKLLTSSRRSDDLSTGLDRDRGRRQRESTNNKCHKGKYHVRIHLKDIFGFAEYQEKGTYELGYKLTLTRNTDNAVLNKGNGKMEINAFGWYILHYTPRITQENILMNQTIENMAAELRYPERPVIVKEVNTQNFWTFELGTQEGINNPICIFVIFLQIDRQHDQNLNSYQISSNIRSSRYRNKTVCRHWYFIKLW